ncbi:uncharacterized protein LOC136767846 [Amia ocellicauda]|uniref:uncharacterized protein LOC136767846 n=1 Tax=Amia ocellicauda TaxID=2972642 RepID=UPI003463E3B4
MALSPCLNARLSSALAELMRAALCEIWKAVEETVSESRVEITRRQRENEALRRRLQELMVAGEAAVCHWSSGADGPPVQSRGAGRREGDTRAAADGAVEASALPDSGERAPIEQQPCEQEWGSSLRQDTEPTDTEDKQGLTDQLGIRQSEEKLIGLESGRRAEPQTEDYTQGQRAGAELVSTRTQCEPTLLLDHIKIEDDTAVRATQTPFKDALHDIKPEIVIESICNLPTEPPPVDRQLDPQSTAPRTELCGGSDSAVGAESPSSQRRKLRPRPSTSHTPPSRHNRKHRDRHSCSQCEKTFRDFASFKKHACIQTGEKPFCCTQCGKSFTLEGSLKTHQRIHTGEKPYSCKQCGKRFSHSASLSYHQLIHTGKKPYSCNQCGRSFTLAGTLKTHQRIHTGEKPYCCSHCGKSFSQAGNFKSHLRIHTGEKPYCCPTCGKRFSRTGSLHYHQRVHTADKSN